MPKLDLFLFQDVPYPGFVEMAELADEHGFKNLWLIDSTDVYPSLYATAALCAVNTSQIRIGPGVTNPRTRHPRVTANDILTVHELSEGRAILGLGSGDHAVKTLGWRRANVQELNEAVEIWRGKFREKGADIPIYVAIGGPKINSFAFTQADGIIGGGGNTPEKLRRGLERIKAGAKEAGRDFKKIPWVAGFGFAIAYDRQVALDDMRGPLARGLKGMSVDLPQNWPTHLEHLRADAEKVGKAYDYMNHMKSHVPHAELVTDALVEEFGMAGTPDEVLPKMKALWDEAVRMEEEGVDITFNVTPAGRGRKRSFDLFIHEILPQLR